MVNSGEPMTENLLRYNFSQKYLVFDCETNSLNTITTRVWQLGFLTAQGKKITNEFERKIYWQDFEIDDNVAMLNHFDRQTYEYEARDPVEVLDEFESYLYDPEYLIVTMNGLGYDCAVHNSWRKKLGRKTDYSWMNRHIDILATFRAIQAGAKNPPRDDLLAWQYSWLNHRDKKVKASLSAQLKHYSVPFDEALKHNACMDVRLTFQVFWKQLFELDI